MDPTGDQLSDLIEILKTRKIGEDDNTHQLNGEGSQFEKTLAGESKAALVGRPVSVACLRLPGGGNYLGVDQRCKKQ